MNTLPLGWSDDERKRVAEARRLAAEGSPALARLLEKLDEPSWTVRKEVVHAILTCGAAATAPLCALLRSWRDSETVIAALVDALVGLDADVGPEVEALARDRDPAIAADATQILGRRRDARSVPLLLELVDHSDDNVAVVAIEALGRIGGVSAIDRLIEALGAPTFFRVFPAIDVLGRSGDPRAVAPLATLLADTVYTAEAARALGRTGQLAAVPVLGALLASPVEGVARVAAVALAEIATRHREGYGSDEAVDEAVRLAIADASIVQGLCRALLLTRARNDDSQREDVAAIALLGTVGGEEAIACLIALVSRPEVAAAAAHALGKIGRAAEHLVRAALHHGRSAERSALLPLVGPASSIEELTLCTTDQDAGVRALACDALARVRATSAVGALFLLLGDDNQRVQQAAFKAILALDSDETSALALRAADSDDAVVRRLALRILGYFGFAEALPVFLAAIGGNDERLREAAILGLAHIEAPAALDALVAASAASLDKTRAVAARALGHTDRKGDLRIAAVLRRLLDDGAPWVRYYACQALGRLGIEDSVDELTARLRDDAGQVRVAAIEALSNLRTRPALEALCAASLDEDPDVKRAALLGLGTAQMPEGLAVLLREAGSADASTRLIAIAALAASGGAHALPALAKAARDPDENVGAAAVALLGGIAGSQSVAALIELLRVALRAGGPIERVTAVLSRPSAERIEGIHEALAWADDALATVLVSCLARQRSEAEAGLVGALAIDSVAARKAAAIALGNLRTTSALAALRRAALSDLDADVRRLCHLVVGP